MANDFFDQLLANKEWYDNSTLDTIDRCVRKGFWRSVFTIPLTIDEQTTQPAVNQPAVRSGVAERVGNGAFFGTCIHSALDKYYAPAHRTKTLQQRRIYALRAFAKTHELLFLNQDVETKYSQLRGLDLLDLYFDHYEIEDQQYEPIETEIAIVAPMSYRPTDPYWFSTFYYVMVLDGVIRRQSYDDLFILEHKTASGPEMKLVELELSRQVRGYFWGLSQFPTRYSRPLEGVMANVIAVRAEETNPSKLFFRQPIHLTPMDAELFRLQTIHKVTRWRKIKELAAEQQPGPLQLAAFDQTTSECTRYGKCTYYDLCLYGPAAADLSKFQRNTWNPLASKKDE